MDNYPEGLLDWSGDRAGGVKKLFYNESGRPAGDVVKTRLLAKLQGWAHDLALGKAGTPRVVFLVGGPGNGKTEAVEYTIHQLDAELGLGGTLRAELADRFLGTRGQPSRRVQTEQTRFPALSRISAVAIVQDGSEADPSEGASPAECLCNDLGSLIAGDDGLVYMACVNRGILDDALILATERRQDEIVGLLKQIVQSASLSSVPIACWPLESFPKFAAWPMDVESLVEEAGGGVSAARQILEIATDEHRWPAFGTCDAGDRCPFCTNRRLLASDPHKASYLRILRWYELASGKRWNFRDLFSLSAFLLAGAPDSNIDETYRPCGWAASMLSAPEKDARKRETKQMRGLLKLVTSQYQHALFNSWPVARAASLRADLKELKLEGDPVLTGLQQFLAVDKRKEPTSTLRTQIAGMAEYLDPAFASPGLEVQVSGSTKIKFEDIDRRFSLSVDEGRSFLQKFQCLTKLEIDLLKSLGQADSALSEESVRRRKPATAGRVQAFVRLVACRVARRSIGVRCGTTRDADVLAEFASVLDNKKEALHAATEQVEGLLNRDRKFLVGLNTTFGEPLPPPERRVTLAADVQRVHPMPVQADDKRPRPPVRFLSVGSAKSTHVALTYELFKATKSLQKGLIPSSLPRSVVALLDITRAKLAGGVVRDEETLQNSEIQLGIRTDIISRGFGEFRIKRRGA